MPKYLIERKITDIGKKSQNELKDAARKSNEALKQMGGEVQWLESFVTDNATFCVYVAPNEELVRRHAEISGFPADRITQIKTVIDPSTGEALSAKKAA